jgi:hypothetical protein
VHLLWALLELWELWELWALLELWQPFLARVLLLDLCWPFLSLLLDPWRLSLSLMLWRLWL